MRLLIRVLAASLLLLPSFGCGPEQAGPTADVSMEAPELEGIPLNAANGESVPDTRARAVLTELTRLAALALQDSNLRALLYTSIQSSPFSEGKLEFSTFTEASGSRFLEAMAGKRGANYTVQHMKAFRDSSVSLEFYMPVPAHRTSWKGDSRIIVATSLYDEDLPTAFDVNGVPYPFTSASMIPDVPMLSLVPKETDFRSPLSRAECLPEDCPTGGDGGGTPPTAPRGIYMTKTHIYDLREGALRGSPELEVVVIGPVVDTLSQALISCAHEGQSGPRWFNQDGMYWTGSVLVLDSLQLANIKSKYPPNTAWQDVRFMVQFWEDDTNRCQIATDVNQWSNYRNAVIGTILGGIGWWGVAIGDVQIGEPQSWPLLAVFPLGVRRLIQIIGGNDEDVGEAVAASRWNPMHPTDQVTTMSHVVLIGSNRNGAANFVWR